MSTVENRSGHAALMDGVYRHQRHFYDLTRKYYLLGRDRMIAGLDAKDGDTVLELGCGTGRNLILAARSYPSARFYGLDISNAMLATACSALAREGLCGVELAQGDATAFNPKRLFAQDSLDRIFISYSLSMIPGWEQAITAALDALKPGGSLHIVDFGSQEKLPNWFRSALRAWLEKFHVAPRDSLHQALESACQTHHASLSFETLYRGYAVHAIVRKR
ncbi:methyltransferase domain-containing protein [Mesorhizobium sp. NBSH29]|uniref:class I SAM-dependent methyltransferase n=1 Tax=Mesorhizobium sp. NBSH29 TaxID=2654249 RepID=UPI00189651C9|nr:class I SAM-dependent methyltransferase [Mesorhizobium sp. NBSH29]QPC88231.1 methyltransferase domain-containing protein [Mesorhizobium sp. NBSH29]